MAVGQATPPPSVVFFSPIGCVAAAKSLPCNTRHLLPHSPFLRKVFVGVLHLISDTSRNPSSNIGSISCSKVITSPSFDGRSFDGRSEVALPKSNLPTFHSKRRLDGRLDWTLAISSRSTSLSPVSLRHMACSWQSNLPSRPRYALRVVETISSLPKVSATRRQCRNVFSSHLSHSSHNHAPSAT